MASRVSNLWQLPTALSATGVMAGLFWMNTQQSFIHDADSPFMQGHSTGFVEGCLERGWPFKAYIELAYLFPENRYHPEDLKGFTPNWLYVPGRGIAVAQTCEGLKPVLRYRNLFLDGAIGLTLLFGTTIASEWFIRRRSPRKPPAPPRRRIAASGNGWPAGRAAGYNASGCRRRRS